jgi:hypothetical protein
LCCEVWGLSNDISIGCRSLTCLKLHGCRELTNQGVAKFARNCTGLKKLSASSCMFDAGAMNTILDHCTALKEFSVKQFKGLNDFANPIGPGAVGSSLKSICLKELINGQCFGPLIVDSKKEGDIDEICQCGSVVAGGVWFWGRERDGSLCLKRRSVKKFG